MSTTDLITGSIEFKLRWLARELRWLNDKTGIDDWVSSVTSLVGLRKTMNISTDVVRTRFSERRYDQMTPWKRMNYTISPHININIEAEPSSERNRSEKRRRDWERRENWGWVTKNKVDSVAPRPKHSENPAEANRGLTDKPLSLQQTPIVKELELKENLKGGNAKEAKDKEMEVDEDTGDKQKPDAMDNVDWKENKEKETKGRIDICTWSSGYLSVYKTKKDWDHEKRDNRKTRIPIVGRKYEVFTREADNSNWDACREGYTDSNGRINHRKGSEDWKWYRINVSNEGDDDYVKVIYNGETLVSLQQLERFDRTRLEK